MNRKERKGRGGTAKNCISLRFFAFFAFNYDKASKEFLKPETTINQKQKTINTLSILFRRAASFCR
jgi:hypothetical protein